jgi:hypothetical protein
MANGTVGGGLLQLFTAKLGGPARDSLNVFGPWTFRPSGV